jgi:hypothetical protein
MRLIHCWLGLFSASWLAAQEGADPGRLVTQLGSGQRADAQRQLTALGVKAVPALIDGVNAKEQAAVNGSLAALCELGPEARLAAKGQPK